MVFVGAWTPPMNVFAAGAWTAICLLSGSDSPLDVCVGLPFLPRLAQILGSDMSSPVRGGISVMKEVEET